jgi:2-polyprenyl-6-hydroxyphenyl methylase/3-demethylubiquinone-9 3-methyltransferase
MTHTANYDPAELAKFSALAHRWWDPESEFRPLHEINPLRLDHIDRLAGGLAGKRVLDVGCGGGILAEAMARKGAEVTGIDLAERPLKVAALHALETGSRVDYRLASAEELAAEAPGSFDVVTCMEMLEHVPDPKRTLAALAALVKPGGDVFVSTINRSLKGFLVAIVGAEYLTRTIPRGTHEYARFIRPSELARWARAANLELLDLAGIELEPLTRQFRLGTDVGVNYLVHLRRALPGGP